MFDKFGKAKLFSDDSRVKVVRDPLRYLWLRILLAVLFVVSIIISFYVGEYWSSLAASERDALRKKNELLKNELQYTKAQLEAVRMDNKISAMSVNQVRDENAALLERIANLEKDITYYQRVMNPIRDDKGLRIDNVDIQNTADANRFRINAVLSQLGKSNRTVIQGAVQINVSGSENGQKRVYSIDELKAQDRDLRINFRFRYYQEISEEIVLPDNFIPESIVFTAVASGAKAMTVQREEPWPTPEG